MTDLFQYVPGNSPQQRMNPVTKIALTLSVFKKLGLLLPLCVPLLISSIRRTGAAATAAEVRGFNLRTRASGYKKYGFGLVDLAALLISAALNTGAALIP